VKRDKERVFNLITASAGMLAACGLALALAAPLASCDIIQGGEAAKPPELDLAEVATWDGSKLLSTFGQPSYVVRRQEGEDYYWANGEQEPTQNMEPADFAQQFPAGDPRLLPFGIIALTAGGGEIIALYVRASYENPAQRIGFLGKRLDALRKPEVGNVVGEPNGTGWSGVNRSEFRYDYKFERGKGPLPKLPFKYMMQVTFDGDSPRVTSVYMQKADN
jgi:hypothetical protein